MAKGMEVSTKVTERDLIHLRRCIELAEEALEAGDEPFGSVLVGGDGTVLAEDRNRVAATGDPTQHPEFALARWAATNMSAEERAAATIYTSGEHCPMCAAANGWVGIGRIVYASSSRQLTAWSQEFGAPAPRFNPFLFKRSYPESWWRGPWRNWRTKCVNCTAACTKNDRAGKRPHGLKAG